MAIISELLRLVKGLRSCECYKDLQKYLTTQLFMLLFFVPILSLVATVWEQPITGGLWNNDIIKKKKKKRPSKMRELLGLKLVTLNPR